MDADSDNDAGFEVGRRRASLDSSRASSPVAKRPKRSFTPTSDDGDLAIPVPQNEDVETPTHESPPLIRQAVGFSWTPSIGTNVTTYQATVAPQPAVPYFLPGQAPSAPLKQKPTKPRAPRKKKGAAYSSQTSKFKLSGSNLSSSPPSGPTSLISTSVGTSANTSLSSGATPSPALSYLMAPVANHAFPCTNGDTTNGPTNVVASDAPQVGTKRRRRSTKKRDAAPLNASRSQPNAQPIPGQFAPAGISTPPRHPINGHSGELSVEGPEQPPDPHRTHSAQHGAGSNGTITGRANAFMVATQGPATNASRPLRMVTLLIEDMRSGAADSQLAEVKVPLKAADDPEDGFWADALEICNALQSGPSRIDGPAKVYTMRGKFRQFFMRTDQYDQLQVQSAYLGVSKERTLSVFVEAPVPQGQLPRPPVWHPDARPVYNSGSERDGRSSPGATYTRPTYSLVTREDQIERLSRSNHYARVERRMSPFSEGGSYDHAQAVSANGLHRPRHDSYAGSIQRILSPPIPGRLADTQEEKDDAIANYIRSRVENHPGWIDYMQSKAKPQRVSEVLKQYTFVDDRVRELSGLKTPPHWDGAPSCYVERQHVWRVLRLDAEWGEECEETLKLLAFYGKDGSRYEDSRVIDMVDDTSPPRSSTMDKFIRFLREVDENFTQDMLSGQFSQ